MRGSVRRRGNSWEFRFRELDPYTGKPGRERSQGGFASQKAAQAALRKQLHDMDSGSYVAKVDTTLADFVRERWLPAIEPTLRPATFRSYARNMRLHVLPVLGDVPIQRLTPLMLNALYADMLRHGRKCHRDGGLSHRSVRYVHTIVHRCLRDAMRWQLVMVNVAAAADPPRLSAAMRMPPRTWTADQVRSFLVAMVGNRRYAAFLLLASTGMRRGEVLGLTWDNLDLDRAQLSVTKTLVDVDSEVQWGAPKTQRGRRLVQLDKRTVAALREHRARQLQERLAAGAAYQDQNLVFATRDGRFEDPKHFTREFYRCSARVPDLPRIRLHDLRHTWATLALERGIHPKVVSERLGHASIGITLDIYSHVTPAMQADAAETVAAAIFGLMT
jgi:integrase